MKTKDIVAVCIANLWDESTNHSHFIRGASGIALEIHALGVISAERGRPSK